MGTRQPSKKRHFATIPTQAAGAAIAILLLGATTSISSVSAQSYGKRVFTTQASCALAGWLTADECKNAYVNALVELDEKAPRFSSRAECEQNFKRCMIAVFNRKHVEFAASLKAFEVTARPTGEKTTLPLIEGESATLGLQPRPIARPSLGVSLSRQAKAQAQWTQAQKARAAAIAAPAAAGVDPADASTPEPSLKWYVPAPPPPSDPAAAERRRNEIQKAPTVY